MGIYVEEYDDGRIISTKNKIKVDYKTAKNIRWV